MAQRRTRNKRVARGNRAANTVNVFFLSAVSVVMVLPLLFILNHSFKPVQELFVFPPRFLVREPTLDNFRDLFFAVRLSVVPISRFVLNSAIVTVGAVGISMTIGSMAAFAMSKLRFPGKDFLFGAIIVALMFAPQAVQITRYLVVSRIGVMNTYMGHLLPQVALPVGVFLIKQFMDQVPSSLIESAQIDGATDWMVYAKIVMPLVLPALATAGILAFQAVWTDQSTSQYYMTDEAMRTLPYFVSSLHSQVTAGSGADIMASLPAQARAGQATQIARAGAAAAAGFIMFVPNFLIFIALKKSMVSTLVNSGIK